MIDILASDIFRLKGGRERQRGRDAVAAGGADPSISLWAACATGRGVGWPSDCPRG